MVSHLGRDLHQKVSWNSLEQQGGGVGVQARQQGGLEVGALDVHQAGAARAGEGEGQVGMLGLLPTCPDSNQIRPSLQAIDFSKALVSDSIASRRL